MNNVNREDFSDVQNNILLTILDHYEIFEYSYTKLKLIHDVVPISTKDLIHSFSDLSMKEFANEFLPLKAMGVLEQHHSTVKISDEFIDYMIQIEEHTSGLISLFSKDETEYSHKEEIKYELNNTQHEISSNNVLLEKDTGRVIAVFYNDYDLEDLLEQLNNKSNPSLG